MMASTPQHGMTLTCDARKLPAPQAAAGMAQPSGHAKVWVWAMPALASALGVAGSAVSTAHAWHLRLFFFLFWCCSPLWPVDRVPAMSRPCPGHVLTMC